jgi:hypothetical protein
MKLPICATVSLIVCLSTGVAFGQPVRDDKTNVHKQPPSVEERFVGKLQSLSLKWKVGFVVEGTPIVELTVPDMPGASESLQARVATIAGTYDYDVAHNGTLFLFTKRYTNSADYPDVTPEEYRLSLVAGLRILEGYDPKFAHEDAKGSPIAAIGRLLTPEQTDALAQGGLPVQSLSQSQRDEVRRIALRYYVQLNAQTIRTDTAYFNSIFKQDPVFKWKYVAGVDAFGFEMMIASQPKLVFQPISHLNSLVVSPKGNVARLTVRGKDGSLRNGIDTTDPAAERSDPITIPPQSHTGSTLNTVAVHLNAASNGANVYRIDPTLDSKRVTMVGQDHASPYAIFKAIATVYGLQVVQEKDLSLLLTRRRDPTAQTLADVGKALADSVPTPWLRWFHGRLQSPERRRTGLRPMTKEDYEGPSGLARLAAFRLLRAKIEPLIAGQKDKEIRLSGLQNQDKELFALGLAVPSLGEMTWMGERAVPPYIADFDQIILTGGLTPGPDGKPRLEFFLSYRDPETGAFSKGVGFFNARVPQDP